ncbi:MAG: hypothetical protein V3V08_00365 [Nannocystaceae bacterium]
MTRIRLELRFRLPFRFIVVLYATAVSAFIACARPASAPDLRGPDDVTELTSDQRAHIRALVGTAAESPQDFTAQKIAGFALMHLTLSGALHLQRHAELHLERAYELRQDDAELNRTLGRFYNMRAVDHDFSKSAWQQRVYASLLGEQSPRRMSDAHFIAYSFFSLAELIRLADQHKLLRAFSRLRQLERDLEDRVHANPDDVELRALAGNFALFFAGEVPVGRRRRIDRGIRHFEFVRRHWDRMGASAKDPQHCPNTYENFMFELAEAHLARDHEAQARQIYQELARVRSPRTRAKELIAAVSEHRLAYLGSYRGDLRLMPPWPSDVGNCVVCHSYTGEIPEHSLRVHSPLHLDRLPTAAVPKPADTARLVAAKIVTIATDYPATAAPLLALIRLRCASCHFPGGRAAGTIDLSRYKSVMHQADAISETVADGTMPPTTPLSTDERRTLSEWLTHLGDR